jgi:hypothetical protein
MESDIINTEQECLPTDGPEDHADLLLHYAAWAASILADEEREGVRP